MSAQTEITKKYGPPGDAYEKKYCELWDVKKDFPELAKVFPKGIYINKEFHKRIAVAFTLLRAAGLLTEIKKFDGCYVKRNTRGTTTPSLHSWAMAVDLNAAQNPMVFHHVLEPFKKSGFTKGFVDIMEASGLFWGGYYSHRFDPMHFSLYNG